MQVTIALPLPLNDAEVHLLGRFVQTMSTGADPKVIAHIRGSRRFFRGAVAPTTAPSVWTRKSRVTLMVSTDYYGETASLLFAGYLAIAYHLEEECGIMVGNPRAEVAAFDGPAKFELGNTIWDKRVTRVAVDLMTSFAPKDLEARLGNHFTVGLPDKF